MRNKNSLYHKGTVLYVTRERLQYTKNEKKKELFNHSLSINLKKLSVTFVSKI